MTLCPNMKTKYCLCGNQQSGVNLQKETASEMHVALLTSKTAPRHAVRWCPRYAPDMPQFMPQTYLSVSYLISSKRLLFENIAHDGSFWHCTWLYLALPGSAMIYDLWPMRGSLTHATAHSPPHGAQPNPTTDLLYNRPPQHRLIGLNAFVYTGLNAHAQKGMYGMEISVSNSSKSTALWC